MKKKLVVLTGAGISAESGLKTFRDSDGLWENYSVEDVATASAWKTNPKLVLEFYNIRRRDAAAAQPNAAHFALAELEQFFDVTVITQNVDDLHERAGSTKVVHLHGELSKMRSVKTTKFTYPYDKDIALGDTAPDGGQLRPYIVWFEEDVPMIPTAAALTNEADIFAVIGTSLQVYPAATLVNYTPVEATLYIVDKDIPSSVGDHFTKLQKSATEGVVEMKDLLISKYCGKEAN